VDASAERISFRSGARVFRLAIAGRTRPDRTGLGLANFRVAVVTPKPPQLDQGSLYPYYRARSGLRRPLHSRQSALVPSP
jgi:hypothetical protein